MPDYQKMYHLLVGTMSETADLLDIYGRLAAGQSLKVKQARREAEELYISDARRTRKGAAERRLL